MKNENTNTNNPTSNTNEVTNPNFNNNVNPTLVAELKEKFDTTQNELNSKEYSVYLNPDQTEFFLNYVYDNITWKGYESYAISETNTAFRNLVKKGEINGGAKPEMVEAIFHFLKNFTGTGVNNATTFRQICDQFAVPMTEINEDRQVLRDLSLELVAAEQGIPVENVIENLQKQYNNNN